MPDATEPTAGNTHGEQRPSGPPACRFLPAPTA